MNCVRVFFLFCIVGVFLSYVGVHVYAQSGSLDIDALVEGCGDSIIGSGEDCDTANLGGATCGTQGFTSGTLSCTSSCFFNTSACVLSSGGSGGGSNNGNNRASVVFVGKAYPASEVTLLKDGQVVAKTVASSLANFQVHISGLSSGSYLFSVYGEDSRKFRSPLLTFPVTVSKGILTKIEDVFIAPTIAVDKSSVRKGDAIAIFGQSVPLSNIMLEVNSPQQFFVQTPADKNGVYLHNFDTAVLDMGSHTTQGKSATNTEISSKSMLANFQVGTQNVLAPQNGQCPQKADLNNDCKVNLVDFSVAAFWYQRTLDASFAVRERSHLNGDGKVNIIDFSIMAFYWTG